MAILTFDFGGTFIKYGVWKENKINYTNQFNTPKTWQELTEKILEVKKSFSKIKFSGVGISAPGVVNCKTRKIEGISALPYIHYRNIFSELEELLGLPVVIENDANCAGIAEVSSGVAMGVSEVVFVVVGTGIGGSIFHNGKIYKGKHLYGGEFGLMFLKDNENFSKLGTAVKMARRYCDRLGVSWSTYTGEEVFKLAQNGDLVAQEEVEVFYDSLTKGLFGIQLALDPEMIVLGGGISAMNGLIPEINQRMKRLFLEYKLKDFLPKIVACRHQNNANLIGAAYNFINQYYSKT